MDVAVNVIGADPVDRPVGPEHREDAGLDPREAEVDVQGDEELLYPGNQTGRVAQ